ncbi:MAG TPA: vWA domain-containing protein, partial [Gemmataceae bacterium]|nr:vWA domain-containing protein [Gemmataceae bacterium]
MSLLSFAWFRRAALLAAAGLLLTAAPARAADDRPEPKKPKIEVVFCLDTTGSMTGLIEGAKAKIWTICNQIAGGKPTPELKVGLVAYRDRGKEEYVTRVFDLTDDLDAVHGQLKGFRAAGGGDFPESVNEALHVAVNKITWGQDKSALRIIFLVGDAPPHM